MTLYSFHLMSNLKRCSDLPHFTVILSCPYNLPLKHEFKPLRLIFSPGTVYKSSRDSYKAIDTSYESLAQYLPYFEVEIWKSNKYWRNSSKLGGLNSSLRDLQWVFFSTPQKSKDLRLHYFFKHIWHGLEARWYSC